VLKKQILATLFALSAVSPAGAQANTASSTCTLTPQEFDAWFASGKASKGGIVNFANSVGFPLQNTTCDFYKWAHQMFLWVTSPINGSILIDSPVFFDVNVNSQGQATYVPNSPGVQNNRFALRGSKHEKIQPGGQAGGGDTLLSLNGSLVYFAMHANDVYAWFNTAVTNGVLPATTPFPTTQAELTSIVNYANQNNAKLGDANALTMEMKTAWIDAATVKNLADYITISAAVPNYVKKSDTLWQIGEPATVVKTLALVGVHVVGPVQGHPEMVWATFEHGENAPNNEYYLSDGSGKQQLVPYNSKGTWSFMTNGGAQAGALVSQMVVGPTTTPSCQSGQICATAGNTIQANNVYRAMPWGNQPTAASADNNTQIFTLTNTISGFLGKLDDVRAKYFEVGAVWTQNGSIPSSGSDTAKQIGSKLLANSTMETYHQTDTNGCFGCHNGASSTATSHLFSITNNPLVPK